MRCDEGVEKLDADATNVRNGSPDERDSRDRGLAMAYYKSLWDRTQTRMENDRRFLHGKHAAGVPDPARVQPLLSTDSAARKDVPLATGCLDYFPLALAEVAKLSKVGNDKHNPGEPINWSRHKSSDHADSLLRHFTERGKMDKDGIPHSAKAAWRALAILQLELEAIRAEKGD